MSTEPTNKRPPMVGLHLDPELMSRLHNEQVRRIRANVPSSERTQSHICRQALAEYLDKQEILS